MSVFLIGLFVLLVGITILTNSIIGNSNDFKMDEKTKILILGHSHPEGSLNDSLINGAKNFAQGGETYFYAYLKTKKLLEENSQIKTIFVEFTNNQVALDMEDWESDEKKIVAKIPRYAPIMNGEEYGYVAKKNPLALLKALQLVIKNNINFVLYNKKDYIKTRDWGGYYYNKRSHIDSIIKVQKKMDFSHQTIPEISTVNLNYLDRIIDLCKKQKVKLYLFRSPQHKKYLGKGNESQFQEILKSRFSNVDFLDFNDFPLKDEDYGDMEHLNYKGARKFSKFFNELLTKGVLENKETQSVINQKMTLLEPLFFYKT